MREVRQCCVSTFVTVMWSVLSGVMLFPSYISHSMYGQLILDFDALVLNLCVVACFKDWRLRFCFWTSLNGEKTQVLARKKDQDDDINNEGTDASNL